MELKSYIALVKPGIVFGNALTAAAGFALASRRGVEEGLLAWMLIGLSLVIAGACAFNNYIDREADQKMARTQNRPLATGMISPRRAIESGFLLSLTGLLVLGFKVNLLSSLIALTGLGIYVFVYSALKYQTPKATLIGSLAGAVPPAVGYCAASGSFDLGALLLLLMTALWQMPHFFAIALYRLKEYAAASIPVLPISRGITNTKIQIVLYVVAFLFAAFLLPFFGYVGTVYRVTVAILGLGWFGLALWGFKAEDVTRWARGMFLSSLVVITGLCTVIIAAP